MTELEKKFLSLLQAAVQNKASDIHLMTSQAPAIRGPQGLVSVNLAAFTAEEMISLCQFMLTDPKLKQTVSEIQDYDGSFEVKGIGRFRVNIYRSVSGLAAVLRVIATHIPTIDGLGLPQVLKKVAEASRGLILVTGATGSGKSSTLAAMINHLNESDSLHILTIEDPVEFLHPQKKSRMSQREIGRDTTTFAQALRSALRQDPDVILVGEMRDYETLDIALKAAETGHLVFSTVHTSDAMKTIGRLISLFPPEEQNSARIRLGDNLHAIVSQRLVPSKAGGKVVAQEIMINNVGIQECIINEKKTSEIPGFIEKGKEVSGMQTFDQHLADLTANGVITVETALAYATNPNDFQRNLSFGSASGIQDNSSSFATQMEGSSLQVDTIQKEEEAPAQAANPAPPPGTPMAPPRPIGAAPAAPQKPAGVPPTPAKMPKPPGAA